MVGTAGAAPAFSIIVPVHDVADYLDACLDSILTQSFDDLEVIAVDDASTDGSGARLDGYAARDPRVTAVHLAVNGGVGAARNVGLDRARGRYLLFVDSDDELAPDALTAIADRVAAAGAPDIVMFGFARTYADGRVLVDPRSAALAGSEPPREVLFEIIPVPWNKAYRRDFVAASGLRFDNGIYEDMPWSYPLLISAASLATLDRVCYLYRQREAGGNLLSASDRRQLDLFAQYDRTFAYLDAHPEFDRWRPRLFDRLTRHVPTVLETAGRVPPRLRREYFLAASAAFARHRPTGYRTPGRAGLKVRLIERGDYRSFRAAQLANRVARRLRAATTRRPT